MIQINPRKDVLDREGYTSPTRQATGARSYKIGNIIDLP